MAFHRFDLMESLSFHYDLNSTPRRADPAQPFFYFLLGHFLPILGEISISPHPIPLPAACLPVGRGRGEGEGTFLFDFYNRLFFKRPPFSWIVISLTTHLRCYG